MNLEINRELVIPYNEIQWRFSRSSGPGGQSVNKTESRVEIRFNISNSKALNTIQKVILLNKLKNRINNGCISIKVQKDRTQYENRKLAKHKLITLIKASLMSKAKTRKVTKPTKASQTRRVASKKKRGELKRTRKKTFDKDL